MVALIYTRDLRLSKPHIFAKLNINGLKGYDITEHQILVFQSVRLTYYHHTSVKKL